MISAPATRGRALKHAAGVRRVQHVNGRSIARDRRRVLKVEGLPDIGQPIGGSIPSDPGRVLKERDVQVHLRLDVASTSRDPGQGTERCL